MHLCGCVPNTKASLMERLKTHLSEHYSNTLCLSHLLKMKGMWFFFVHIKHVWNRYNSRFVVPSTFPTLNLNTCVLLKYLKMGKIWLWAECTGFPYLLCLYFFPPLWPFHSHLPMTIPSTRPPNLLTRNSLLSHVCSPVDLCSPSLNHFSPSLWISELSIPLTLAPCTLSSLWRSWNNNTLVCSGQRPALPDTVHAALGHQLCLVHIYLPDPDLVHISINCSECRSWSLRERMETTRTRWKRGFPRNTLHAPGRPRVLSMFSSRF